jgi:hypothetical protein
MHRRPHVPNRKPVRMVTPPRVVRPVQRKLPPRQQRGGR